MFGKCIVFNYRIWHLADIKQGRACRLFRKNRLYPYEIIQLSQRIHYINVYCRCMCIQGSSLPTRTAVV